LEESSCYPCFTIGTPAPPCDLEVIANAIPENEDCGDDNNGGCNMATPAFGNIFCGQTKAKRVIIKRHVFVSTTITHRNTNGRVHLGHS
jgi:hypothetical protein